MLEPSSLNRDDGNRIDGITVYPYSRGRFLIWDATCVKTFASSSPTLAAEVIKMIRMEVASSRPYHLPTLSADKTSELSQLVKSPFGGGGADAGNATPNFCFIVPAISKLTTLTVESLWTAPTETAKHHILAIYEAS